MACRFHLLASLLLLTACTDQEEPDLRLGLLDWPGAEPVHLAGEIDILDEDRIDCVEFENPADLASAFRLGGVDAACLTADFAVDLAQSIPELNIVFTISHSVGADLVLARTEIATMADLRGGRIGLEVNPSSAHVLDGLLRHADLEVEDVELVSVDIADHRHAFDEHDLDALVTHQPYAHRAMTLNGLHVVFDSSAIPWEIVDVLLTRKSVLETKDRVFDHLIDGWTETLDRIGAGSARLVEFGARRGPISEAEYRRMLADVEILDAEDNRRLLVEQPESMIEILERCETVLRRWGIVRRDVDLQRLPDGRFFDGPAP
ncbi:MAG TPA: ABC transporter substrate-binding protein [Candidatus Krumholzibacteria bacterium]|nr:ABC transporter substrate-binding protein [Candidatus Krumholzibacteria bacterium]